MRIGWWPYAGGMTKASPVRMVSPLWLMHTGFKNCPFGIVLIKVDGVMVACSVYKSLDHLPGDGNTAFVDLTDF
jgi:hypothetical protein